MSRRDRPPSPRTVRGVSHPAMYVLQPVDLHKYRADFRAGKFANLTYNDKVAMFGTGTMPIFVPLASGETMDEYEERFIEWLHGQGESLEELRDSHFYEERSRRIAFANANSVGAERYDDWKADQKRCRSRRSRSWSWSRSPSRSTRSRSRSPSKLTRSRSRSRSRSRERNSYDDRDGRKSNRVEEDGTRDSKPNTKLEASAVKEDKSEATKAKLSSGTKPLSTCVLKQDLTGTSPASAIAAHLECGCSPCLFAAMGLMDKRLQQLESKSKVAKTAHRVVDLTLDDDTQSPRVVNQ